MIKKQPGVDEPLLTRRMEDGKLIYTAKVELALPTGPLVLAVDFRVEYDELDVDHPTDASLGTRGSRLPGMVSWWGTITLTDVPPGLLGALGRRVPIRTRIGHETHVLVSKIDPPRAGVGADVRPSVVRLDGSGPLPRLHDHDAEEQRALRDVTWMG